MMHNLALHCARGFLRSLLVLVILAGVTSPATAAPNCNVWSSNLSFGRINLLYADATNDTATVTYACSANPGQKILVCVSLAADPGTNGFSPRYLVLNSGDRSRRLAFNMYSDPAHTQVWGGVGASGGYAAVPFVMSFGPGQHYLRHTATIYGQVNSNRQTSLPAGRYDTDMKGNWPISITYQAYTGSAPSCSSSGMSTATGAGFYISAVLQSDCRVNSSSEMNFGNASTLDHDIDTSAAISLTCNGAPYHVLLGDGQNAVSAKGQRRMKGPNGQFIDYELYKDAQRTQRWGNNKPQGVAGTGNGQPQSLEVYGRVPPQQPTPQPGTYTDTVVITVDY